MDQLINLIGDERVSIASAEKNKWGRNEALDKDMVKKSLEVKQKMADTAKELDDKTPEERAQWIEEQKNRGDELYRNKDCAKAMQVYLEALMGLSEESLGKEKVSEFKIKILSNMAMCAVEVHQYTKALDLLKQAISVDPDYWKSYLKQAIVYERAERFEKAVYSRIYSRESITLAKAFAKSDSDKEEVEKRRTKILSLKKQYDDKQRAAYSNIFAKDIYVCITLIQEDKKAPDLSKLEKAKKRKSNEPVPQQRTLETEEPQVQSDDEDYDSRDDETKKLPFWKSCCSKKKRH